MGGTGDGVTFLPCGVFSAVGGKCFHHAFESSPPKGKSSRLPLEGFPLRPKPATSPRSQRPARTSMHRGSHRPVVLKLLLLKHPLRNDFSAEHPLPWHKQLSSFLSTPCSTPKYPYGYAYPHLSTTAIGYAAMG